MDAYERLEAEMKVEADRAAEKYKGCVEDLTKRLKVIECELETSRHSYESLERSYERLELQLAESKRQNTMYEEGVYGLPEVGKHDPSRQCAVMPCL